MKFKYHIKDHTDEQIEIISDMNSGESKENIVTLFTSNLPSGKYTVWTVLDYKIEGIGHIKYLTLELTIY